MHKTTLIIAIDGPAGAGKTTIAQTVGKELGLTRVDTGAMFRAVGYLALQQGIELDDPQGLAAITRDLQLKFVNTDTVQQIFVNGQNISQVIRTPEVANAASIVSTHQVVRQALLDMQRQLAHLPPGAVLEGRDIGTVVCPDADLKIYLDASPNERAKRRLAQLQENDPDCPMQLSEIEKDIKQRDKRDMQRQLAPLKPAKDAKILDCSAMNAAEVTAQIVAWAKQLTAS